MKRCNAAIKMVDDSCIFCSIASGRMRAFVVLDEADFLAFLDHRPLFEGHCLLVPRSHYEVLTDLPEHLMGPLMRATQRLSGAVEEAMEADGYFVAMNNRVSQSVHHLHVHVVPRRKKDGLKGFFWPRHKYESDARMAAVAEGINKALGNRE